MNSDTAIEARLIAAALVHEHVLELAADVESRDFSFAAHRALWTALRNVQASGRAVTVDEVFGRIEETDRVTERTEGQKIEPYVLKLLHATTPYADDAQVLRDCAMLRVIRQAQDAQLKQVERPEQPGFARMPNRIHGELAGRLYASARALNYHNAYLDDCLRVILPHDLVLLGAPTGLGKTELALSIAMANAGTERRVAYFALEAEPLELERRIKFAWLSAAAYQMNHPRKHEMNYTDWFLGNCEDICAELNPIVDQRFLAELGGLWTFYRGAAFDADHLCKAILDVHQSVDLIVVDHLHYIDTKDDSSEQRALGDMVKAIRDVSLRVGRPVLLVAHLRKRDPRLKQLIPSLDDFHGSSDITKICTQVITLERAKVDVPRWFLSPTYIAVLKDRRAGTNGLVALTHFDRRTRSYEANYTLGRLIKGGTEWEALKVVDTPIWARGHKQLELALDSQSNR